MSRFPLAARETRGVRKMHSSYSCPVLHDRELTVLGLSINFYFPYLCLCVSSGAVSVSSAVHFHNFLHSGCFGHSDHCRFLSPFNSLWAPLFVSLSPSGHFFTSGNPLLGTGRVLYTCSRWSLRLAWQDRNREVRGVSGKAAANVMQVMEISHKIKT